MKKIFLLSICFSICLPYIKFGYDVSSEIDGDLVLSSGSYSERNNYDEDLDETITLGYEMHDDKSMGFGFEYVFFAEIDNLALRGIDFSSIYPSKIDIFSVYMIHKSTFANNSAFLAKIGYSITNLKKDSEKIHYSDDNIVQYSWKTHGDMMWGFSYQFNNMQLSYTEHKGELSGYLREISGSSNFQIDYDSDFKINRVNFAVLF